MMGWLKTLSEHRARLEQELVHVVALQRMAEEQVFTPGGNGDEAQAPATPKPKSVTKRRPRKADAPARAPLKSRTVMDSIIAVLAEAGKPLNSHALYRAVQDREPTVVWKAPVVNLCDFAQRSRGRIRRNEEGEWIVGEDLGSDAP